MPEISTSYLTLNQDWSFCKPLVFEYNGRWIANWFSNFIISPIIIDHIFYKSVENYYQAMKSYDLNDHRYVASLDPNQAKKWGRSLVDIRPDWNIVKYQFMREALQTKFSNPYWRTKLVESKDMLVEWNNWGDEIWGANAKTGWGANALGILLMQIRSELQK